ncbi:hypothetical protein [Nocardia arthritidis]|uniref:Uncharacterized protein n=1 Tax=Nocardia arthritidis TaxID=228602 RepID=A0A6G9Y8B3_9NOCA|nr:hypothetical protein [Nocardia arthritidis]QIS09384.1 hypothetical protein F5544_07390 [Nocardia arthritidis]
MSITTSSVVTTGVEVTYRPTRPTLRSEIQVPAVVDLELTGAVNAYVCLSIEDARSVLGALPRVLAEHAAAQDDSHLAELLTAICELLEEATGVADGLAERSADSKAVA